MITNRFVRTSLATIAATALASATLTLATATSASAAPQVGGVRQVDGDVGIVLGADNPAEVEVRFLSQGGTTSIVVAASSTTGSTAPVLAAEAGCTPIQAWFPNQQWFACGNADADTSVYFSGSEGDDEVWLNSGPFPKPYPLEAYGNGGDDVLSGGDRSDVLEGGAGNDRLAGWGGADVFRGGTGSDIVDYRYSAGVRVDLDGVADDGPWMNGVSEKDNVSRDVESVDGSSYDDVISVSAISQLTPLGSTVSRTVQGNGGNDTIVGGNGTDSLNGGAGSDTVNGGGAFDGCSGESLTNCEWVF